LFGHATYLIWLGLFIGLPLFGLLRWWPWLWQQRRALGLASLGSLLGGWAWDAWAVQFGVWFYEPGNIIGWWFLGLPLEEWLWIVGVTLMFGGLTVVLMEQQK
jgi:lycopene cyclase domain-containing protein